MALPFAPPLDPMLAKLSHTMPEGDGWLYEPKWDGFRAIVFKDGKDIAIESRDRKPLNRYFPELVEPLGRVLPRACVVDGEVVIPTARGLDFDALQMRIHPAESRVKKLAAETPASFVAFDLLALASKDLRTTPMSGRRSKLEGCLQDAVSLPEGSRRKKDLTRAVIYALDPSPTIAITPQTDDAKLAAVWFDAFEGAGLDGIIAKRADLLYLPGKREMVKVKHVRTAECVVGGYRLNKTGDGIGSLLLGLYGDDGVLHYVGHTSSFKAPERRALLKELKSLEGGKSFGGGRAPGGPSRWYGAHGRDPSYVPLEPVRVCEVSYDHLQGERFRHAATFQRWRPDKPPEECTFDQILASYRH